ncbi:MAG: hypothetical protein DRI61_01955 [Chloroflexi bacterium]|nr:MAG: hypothetical protein DRI61_01955 [Chloroflexota bacterium]
MRKEKLWNWIISISYLSIISIMTFPLMLHLETGLPGDLGDPLLNVWILGWETKALTQKPWEVFHPPIFFPHRYTIGFSENLFGFLPVAMPFALAWGNPVLGYNAAFVFAFWISCMGVYKLLYKLTRHRAAAFVVGILFAFAPYRWAQLGHLHILSYGWIAFALATVVGYAENPSRRRLFDVALSSFLAIMLSLHTALFGLLSLGAYVLTLWRVRVLKPAELPRLLATEALVLAISLPFLYPHLLASPTIAADRLPQLAAGAEVKLTDFLAAAPHLKLLGPLTEPFRTLSKSNCEVQLYPGLIVAILALIGAFGSEGNLIKATKLTALALIAVGLAVTLGVGLYVKFLRVVGPHSLLLLPLYIVSPVRALGRWMILTWVGMGILAGFGLRKIVDKATNQTAKSVLILGIALLGILEGWVAPLPISTVTPLKELPEVYHWLARQPGDFAILELPVFYPLYADETRRMYAGLLHGKKLITGYSGVIPRDVKDLVDVLRDFPSPQAISEIARRGSQGLRYVLVDISLPFPEFNRRFSEGLCGLQNDPCLRFVARFGQVYVFEVTTFPGTERFEPDFYRETEVNFGDVAVLRGYGTGVTGEGDLFVVLDWEAGHKPFQGYSATVQAFDAEGRMLAQVDRPPLVEPFTQCWRPGARVRDIRVLKLSSAKPGDVARVGVAIYKWPSLEHLPIFTDKGLYPYRFFWLKGRRL